jgi:3-oxoacyl-[acyl-carrier protein] reductase
MLSLNYSYKEVLILGGSCELALKLVLSLLKLNFRPTLTYRSEEGKERIIETLKDHGDYHLDKDYLIVNWATERELLKDTQINYLIDFLQPNLEGLISSTSEERIMTYWNDAFSVKTLFLKDIARKMIKEKFGRMIFISSVAVSRMNSGQGFYVTSKLAMEGFYKSLGVELGPLGVSTVSLRPGYIDSGRGTTFLKDKDKLRSIKRRIPTRKIITSEEVNSMILYLLSDQALNINATEITMDGGMSSSKLMEN